MKCKPGVTTRTYCLQCNCEGEMVGYSWPMVSMRCPGCGTEWRTLSAICERCHYASGSPWASECPKCEAKMKEAI